MNQNTIIAIIAILIVGIGGYVLVSGNNAMNAAEESTTRVSNIELSNKSDSEDSMEKMENKNTIVDIAVSDDNFSTLVTAVQAAGLVDTLSSEGPFTVLAPTNEAFAKLPEATLQEVLADKEQLTAILTYHVVPGKVMAEDVVNLSSAKTVQGGDLKVMVDGANVMVDNAKVLKTDIEADNGVIHVIDTVLIPHTN